MLPYIKLFPSLREPVDAMDDAMAGRLFKAILNYADGGNDKPEGPEKFVFLMLRAQYERDREDYEKTRAANSVNGAKGGRPRKATGFSENPPVFSESEKSQDKDKEEDKDKEYNIPPAPVVYDELCAYIADNLQPLNNDIMDALLSYRDTLSDDVIRYAVQETLSNGSRAPKYCASILKRWSAAGFKTVSEIKAADDKRKQQQARARPDLKPAKPMITRDLAGIDDEDDLAAIMRRPR